MNYPPECVEAFFFFKLFHYCYLDFVASSHNKQIQALGFGFICVKEMTSHLLASEDSQPFSGFV